MNYSSLEDAFGSPFGQRTTITSSSVEKDDTLKKADNKAKLAEVVKSVESSLPLDKNPATESFSVKPQAPLDPRLPKFTQSTVRDRVREHFGMSGGGGDDSKLDRILRLIEQNRTGYAPATTQDMLLYIATGVFFLFTFDTFVTLGKAMRGR
jgi:cell division protein FtsX